MSKVDTFWASFIAIWMIAMVILAIMGRAKPKSDPMTSFSLVSGAALGALVLVAVVIFN